MTKTLTLETVAFKLRRAKFSGNLWLTLSPFINLDDLKFGAEYAVDIQMDNNNLWFVDSMNPVGATSEAE